MLIMGCNQCVHGCILKVTDETVICINKKAQENCWKCSIVNLGMKFGEHNINLVERLRIPEGRLKYHELGSRGDL
jgi:hypothetical protein